MFKRIIVIFSFTILIYSIAFAQVKPLEQNQQIQQDSLVIEEQSVDSISTDDSSDLTIWNKVCPVMGNKVDVDGPTVEYNGKLYGFCCPGCDAKFEKNPEKYSKNLSDDGTRFIGRK